MPAGVRGRGEAGLLEGVSGGGRAALLGRVADVFAEEAIAGEIREYAGVGKKANRNDAEGTGIQKALGGHTGGAG